jgi:murein L,D-transpeptidase YafK
VAGLIPCIVALSILCCLPVEGLEEVQADRILVRKAARELVLYRQGKVLKSYRVALGRNPVDPKRRQGDRKTPEGRYTITGRNPSSAYHRALRISYPSAADRARARREGVSPGGDIMIHGLPNGQGYIGAAHRLTDWTDGCIAVTNEEIEEIWRLAPNGTPVLIEP